MALQLELLKTVYTIPITFRSSGVSVEKPCNKRPPLSSVKGANVSISLKTTQLFGWLQSGTGKNRLVNGSKISRTMKSPLGERGWMTLSENIYWSSANKSKRRSSGKIYETIRNTDLIKFSGLEMVQIYSQTSVLECHSSWTIRFSTKLVTEKIS